MAIPFIKHSFIGKSKQAQPYTAAAHVRYISRESATVYRYAERMPLHYHAAQRFLNEREDRIRKNGRVVDKLVISIPKEWNLNQSVDAIRNFGFQLSDGRAPFYFTIHGNTEHRHCHFVFVDEAVDGSGRVFKTTDLDSSERIKALWEKVCNKQMQELGIDAKISFSEAAEKKAQRLEDEAYANDNQALPIEKHETGDTTEFVAQAEMTILRPDAPLNEVQPDPEEAIPAEDETDAEDAPEGDEDMAEELTVAERVERIHSIRIEAVRLEHLMGQREVYWEQYRRAREGAEKAALDVADALVSKQFTDQNVYQAQLTLKQYQRDNGKLKGWRIPVVGWKSRTRVEAEQAEEQLRRAEFRHASREQAFREAADYRTAQELRAFELEKKATQLEIQLRVLGTDEELGNAMKMFEQKIADDIWALQTNELEAAYERGEVTKDQYREVLHLSGRDQDLADLDAQASEI